MSDLVEVRAISFPSGAGFNCLARLLGDIVCGCIIRSSFCPSGPDLSSLQDIAGASTQLLYPALASRRTHRHLFLDRTGEYPAAYGLGARGASIIPPCTERHRRAARTNCIEAPIVARFRPLLSGRSVKTPDVRAETARLLIKRPLLETCSDKSRTLVNRRRITRRP